MARTRFNEAAAASLGGQLFDLREKAGEPGYERIARDIEIHFQITASTEQVRKAHVGLIDPYSAQLDLLAGLCQYYEVQPDALGPVAADRLQKVIMLGSRPMLPPSKPQKPKRQANPRCSSPLVLEDARARRKRPVAVASEARYALPAAVGF